MMSLPTSLLFIPLLWAAMVVRDSSAQVSSLHVTDLDGHAIQSLGEPGSRAVVVIFAATDCPISNRYIPEISRLEKEFSSQDVTFWWVFANPEDTIAAVKKHNLEYSIRTKTLVDGNQELVQLAHVSVTPEAAVFEVDHGALREAYHGRIDDLYFSFGHERPAATHHDLEDAIHAVLNGHEPIPASHGPVGCSIIPLAAVNQAK
jgi:hypothetical protein